MLGVAIDYGAYSFIVVGKRIIRGFNVLGYKSIFEINPYMTLTFLSRFNRIIYIGDTFNGLRMGFIRSFALNSVKTVYWTDMVFPLRQLRDEEVKFINEKCVNIATSRYWRDRMVERGLRVDAVVGRPLDSSIISKVLSEGEHKYRRLYGRYILTVGKDSSMPKHPRKGFDRFDEAVGMIKGLLRDKGIKVVAVSNWRFKNVDVNIGFGSLSEEEIFRLYRDAILFVFPSRSEGFGLPPLEAMSVKTPVVYTNIPSHNEFTVGIPVETCYERIEEYAPQTGYVWEVWDYDAKALADAILYALDLIENNSNVIDKLVSKGFEESKNFYEYVIANKLLDVI